MPILEQKGVTFLGSSHEASCLCIGVDCLPSYNSIVKHVEMDTLKIVLSTSVALNLKTALHVQSRGL